MKILLLILITVMVSCGTETCDIKTTTVTIKEKYQDHPPGHTNYEFVFMAEPGHYYNYSTQDDSEGAYLFNLSPTDKCTAYLCKGRITNITK